MPWKKSSDQEQLGEFVDLFLQAEMWPIEPCGRPGISRKTPFKMASIDGQIHGGDAAENSDGNSPEREPTGGISMRRFAAPLRLATLASAPPRSGAPSSKCNLCGGHQVLPM